MPPADAIRDYLAGSFRLMMGKPDGIRMLDISADGFWNSFYAIVVAFPALVVGWVSLTNAVEGTVFSTRFSMLLRIATMDLAAWLVPLLLLAAFARPAGIGGRFVHYVVASNWGSVLFTWMLLPPALLRLIFPGSEEFAATLSFVIFICTLVLSWRMTNAVLGMGPLVASGVFGGMFAASVVVLMTAQSLLGLSPAP